MTKPQLQSVKGIPRKSAPSSDSRPAREWIADNKAIVSVAAAIILLLALYSAVSAFRSGEARLSVYPARGEITFDGKPIPGAVVFLHPNSRLVDDDDSPTPRGTVNADGTFEIGTYGKDDGAPAGDYTLSIKWFSKPVLRDPTNPESEVAPPRNVLPPRYSSPKSSGITVRIQEGENKLPAIALKR